MSFRKRSRVTVHLDNGRNQKEGSMDLDPEFQKLVDGAVDRAVERAVEKHFSPKWFTPREIWIGTLGSLVASALILGISTVNSSEGESDEKIITKASELQQSETKK